MFHEATAALSRVGMGWKPSSISLASRSSCSMHISPGRVLNSSIKFQMLRQTMIFDPDWRSAEDECFQWASVAWATNRKWLLNRKLTLRHRLSHFILCVRNHFVQKLVHVPLSTALLSRVRRWEGRALMKLTGLASVGLTTDQWRGRVLKSRNIVQRYGYEDCTLFLVTNVWTSASRWASIQMEDRARDVAMQDFTTVFV